MEDFGHFGDEDFFGPELEDPMTDPEASFQEDDAYDMGRYDDDPSPYDGTYSEE